jgi:neuropeptide Y receptor
MNQTINEHLYSLYKQNRSLSQPWLTICILCYSILVNVAAMGNILVLVAMARSRELRKYARNVLIGLLATSDLLLSFTMPLTAIDALTKYWPFGKNTLSLCRTVKTTSTVAVYLSSLTLIAIASHRHHCIVHSMR